jgi:antitoxin YefM
MKPTEDIQSLSVFRANVASFVEQVRRNRRPIVLTQRGQSAAVLIGAADYEAMVEELEVLRDINISERQITEGKTVPHDRVMAELREIVESQSPK